MMNQQPPLQGMANQMAQYGRYGDSMLVHMNPVEVQGIAALSPTGSLTTNPVTGQPEAFLPFLAPLLGSAFGSSMLGALGGSSLLGGTALGSALTGIAGNAALSSAIGSGLATTAVTGDLKKGILSGLTGYGLGQVMNAGQLAGNTELAGATTGLEGAESAIANTSTDLAQAQADLASMSATADPSMALPPSEQVVAGDVFGSTQPIGVSGQTVGGAGVVDPARAAQLQKIEGLETQLTAQQTQQDFFKNRIGDINRQTSGFDRLSGVVKNPGAAGAQLIQPGTLATIGTGEGKRGEIEMQERFAREAREFERQQEEDRRRAERNLAAGFAAGGITTVNPNNYMANLRGLHALAGGGRTVQNFRKGGLGRMTEGLNSAGEYSSNPAIFGPGPAAARQKKLHGTVISPEQLQGYRPGFDAEINYFQTATPPPRTTPGTGPGDSPPGSPPGGPGRGPGMGLPPGDISGGPGKGGTMGGIADFDYSQFAESEAGREAIANFRDLTGISDVTNRLSAIEQRPDPTIPQIDYDEITNRVRGGINIPEYDLSGIESRLGAIETREMPAVDLSGIESRLGAIETRETPSVDYDLITQRIREGIDIPEYTAPTIDYDAITQRVREGIDIPTYDTSGIMDAIAANREAIAGMPAPSTVDYDEIANRVRGSIDIPTVDLSGIETRLGAIEGREMPTFDTSNIMSAIDANRQAIAGMPAVDLSGIETRLGAIESREMPTFDTSGIMSAIDANRQAIAGLPAPAPAFDSSGIMDAIAANREAIAGMPAPQTFDDSSILAAIEANRKAIGGINSGGINPNPMAGIPTKASAPTKQAPRRRGFAEGGETEMSADQGSRIIDLTIAAVMGQLPEDQAETVINRFVDEFGSEAFAILRRQVLQGNVPGAQTEGKINGNGGGMDDKVPGMIGDQQPVAVSPGEFIVPADVVSGLGDGSTDAGVEELHGMMDRVRSERTGKREQPRPVNKAKVMPV